MTPATSMTPGAHALRDTTAVTPQQDSMTPGSPPLAGRVIKGFAVSTAQFPAGAPRVTQQAVQKPPELLHRMRSGDMWAPLRAALESGNISDIRRSVLDLLTHTPAVRRDEIEDVLGSLLTTAVLNGCRDQVKALVLAPLLAPPSTLDADGRLALLLSRLPSSPPTKAGKHMLPSIAEEMAALDVSMNPPLMSRLCDAGWVAMPLQREQRRMHRGVHAYLTAIVSSPYLSGQDKAFICASSHANSLGVFTAAQLALRNGNPGAAGCMLVAVLDANIAPRIKTQLLGSLGVSVEEVIAALDELTHPGDLRWSRALVQTIETGRRALTSLLHE